MAESLIVGSWVSVHDGCEVTFDVGGHNAVMIEFRGNGQPFELFLQAGTMRQLVERATKALAEMDASAEHGIQIP